MDLVILVVTVLTAMLVSSWLTGRHVTRTGELSAAAIQTRLEDREVVVQAQLEHQESMLQHRLEEREKALRESLETRETALNDKIDTLHGQLLHIEKAMNGKMELLIAEVSAAAELKGQTEERQIGADRAAEVEVARAAAARTDARREPADAPG